jgi:murein DD-endopeptidase MepM/ murein hydrolase activator NlpD
MVVTTFMIVVLAQPVLELPWACGETYECTQDHTGMSHYGKDKWAWDFGLPIGAEVLAAAPGVVEMARLDSNSGCCNVSCASAVNYVVINHGDGTAALYMHLAAQSSGLSVGDNVSTGDVVGQIGLTGWVCGAHLHFAVQGLCGSYWCQSVPSEFSGYGDPAYQDQLTSENCTVCGADLNRGETVISESDAACFKRVSSYWWNVSEGHEDHHFYTFTTDKPAEETYADWNFSVSASGNYEVFAYIPNTEASSEAATYKIHSADGVQTASVNQTTQKGWQSLGTFRFQGSQGERVHLGDNTGESYDQYKRKLAFDAVRFVWKEAAEEAPLADGQADAGTEASDRETPNESTDQDQPLPPGGCACRSTEAGLPLGLLAVCCFALLRRRIKKLAFGCQ